MAKINICDVCYYEKGRITGKMITSRYRIGYKNGRGMKIALDVCEEHKDFFRSKKTFQEAEKAYNELMFGESLSNIG
jgi:hypothetical protein